MIIGIGIDLIEVSRVKEKVSRNSGFKEKVFSKKEIDYCDSKTHPEENYAARYAAKEAFFKAVGEGWLGKIDFCDIEIINQPNGRPFISLSPNARKLYAGNGQWKIHLTLTHLKETAGAVVVIEKFE